MNFEKLREQLKTNSCAVGIAFAIWKMDDLCHCMVSEVDCIL